MAGKGSIEKDQATMLQSKKNHKKSPDFHRDLIIKLTKYYTSATIS